MLFKNIKKITIAEALEIAKEGLYLKIQDGKITGFTSKHIIKIIKYLEG